VAAIGAQHLHDGLALLEAGKPSVWVCGFINCGCLWTWVSLDRGEDVSQSSYLGQSDPLMLLRDK
jgi:hypothetical protein